MSLAQGVSPAEGVNRVVAHPLLLRIEERVEVKADVTQMSVKSLETGTSHALA